VKLKNASEANLHSEDRLRAEIRRLEGRLVESQNEKRLPAAPADDGEARLLALNEELEEKTRLLVVTTEELAKSKKAFEGLTARAALDISGLHAQIASLQEDVKKAEKKLREEDNKKAIEEATKKLSMRHIVLVQAAVRGFIKRVEVQRTKLFHSARLSGVLVALKTHQQGMYRTHNNIFAVPPSCIPTYLKTFD
jgi:chromosome segregation ATPase